VPSTHPDAEQGRARVRSHSLDAEAKTCSTTVSRVVLKSENEEARSDALIVLVMQRLLSKL